MIDPAKRKLSAVFFAIMLILNIVILGSIFTFVHFSLIRQSKIHIIENTVTEFMPHYKKQDYETLNRLIEDELFQVFNSHGENIIDVQSSVHVNPEVNMSHIEQALSGAQIFEIVKYGSADYLMWYTKLDDHNIVRVTSALEEIEGFERTFLWIALIVFPFTLLILFPLSRYMVNQSLKPVIKIMTYQETFSSSVTHEMNTPLTAIKGNLEVALRQERSSGEYRGILKSALRNINGIISLTINLGLLAQSKFRSLDLFRESANMQDCVNDLMDMYEPQLLSRDLAVQCSVPSDIECFCDISLTKRALGNLLDNAVKYSPEHGVVSIDITKDNRYCIIVVKNSCQGLSKDNLKDLFKPFNRGKDTVKGNIEGKGLGLYIAQYIVESHKGSIQAEIQGNEISVTIRIPGT